MSKMKVFFSASRKWVVEKDRYIIPTIVTRKSEVGYMKGLTITARFLKYWAQCMITWRVKREESAH